MTPEIANHPFWSELFRLGVPMHPEIQGLTPTNPEKKTKIAPTIVNRIQVDICWSAKGGVTCILLSGKPDNLKPYLVDRDAFQFEVGTPKKWSEGSSKYLGVSIKPAPAKVQESWSETRKAEEALKLYGKMKKFILDRTLSSTM